MSTYKGLAQGSTAVGISRCSGGIHLNHGDVSLRFLEQDFRVFADDAGRGSQCAWAPIATTAGGSESGWTLATAMAGIVGAGRV